MNRLVPIHTWTVRIGEASIDEYRNAFAAASIDVNHWAEKDVLRHITPSEQRYDVTLAIQTSEAFGLDKESRFSEHVNYAKNCGYDACPAEAVLAFRLSHLSQPEGEWLQAAMHPTGSGGGYDNVLSLVNHEGRLRLWWSWLHFGLTGYIAYQPGPRRARIWMFGEPRAVVEI